MTRIHPLNPQNLDAVRRLVPLAEEAAGIVDYIYDYVRDEETIANATRYKGAELAEEFDDLLAHDLIDLGKIQARILRDKKFDLAARRPTAEALDLQAIIEMDDEAFDELTRRADIYYVAVYPRKENDISVDRVDFELNIDPDDEDLDNLQRVVEEARGAWEGDFEADFDEEFTELVNQMTKSAVLSGVTDPLAVSYDLAIHGREVANVYIDFEEFVHAIRGELPEEPATPPRELFRVGNASEGFFVVHELDPEYLRFEGAAMGHCVGKPGMGYVGAVRDKEIAILSVRTPAGRPKFTIQARLDDAGEEIVAIDQVKGKVNRLPGMGGKKFKAGEVRMLEEVVRKLGVDPWTVEDLEPGLEKLYGAEARKNPGPRRRSFNRPYQRRPRI